MTRVTTPCRLHFGLLHVPTLENAHWPNEPALPIRRFGGVGMMIDSERHELTVTVEAANEWSAVGPSADRALGFAKRVVEASPVSCRTPLQVVVKNCPPEHTGLGVGTQLGLAVARAVTTELWGWEVDAVQLATMVGRGERSGIGVHGFAHGGFIVDAGKTGTSGVGQIISRTDFPNWPIVLIQPSLAANWFGDREQQVFARSRDHAESIRLTERMCRLVLLGLLPALHEGDYCTFGEALYEYNHAAGEPFVLDQGGIYASPQAKAIVKCVRDVGVSGVGQSSWGPTLFAICEDIEQAQSLKARLDRHFPNTCHEPFASANDHGARVGWRDQLQKSNHAD